jgi:hypothetical protein
MPKRGTEKSWGGEQRQWRPSNRAVVPYRYACADLELCARERGLGQTESMTASLSLRPLNNLEKALDSIPTSGYVYIVTGTIL